MALYNINTELFQRMNKYVKNLSEQKTPLSHNHNEGLCSVK